MKFVSSMMNAKGKPRKPPGKKMVERVIQNFLAKGYSNHSPFGHFLSHILNHCVANRIAFTLVYMPGGGYWVKSGINLQASSSIEKASS